MNVAMRRACAMRLITVWAPGWARTLLAWCVTSAEIGTIPAEIAPKWPAHGRIWSASAEVASTLPASGPDLDRIGPNQVECFRIWERHRAKLVELGSYLVLDRLRFSQRWSKFGRHGPAAAERAPSRMRPGRRHRAKLGHEWREMVEAWPNSGRFRAVLARCWQRLARFR